MVATALISIFILTSTLLAQAPDTGRYWAQWRGPHASGVSATANPPLEWSETKNVRWKAQIPGRGSASPVVWGDRRLRADRRARSASPGDAQHAAARLGDPARRSSLHGAWPSIARPARPSGSASRANRNRTSSRTWTTAPGPPALRSPTASACTPTSSRSASTRTT